MIYFGILISMLVARIVLVRSHRDSNNIAMAFLCVLFLFVGFRYQVGCDWFSYRKYENFSAPIIDTIFSDRDPLFGVTVTIIRSVGLSFYPAINLFCASIFFWGAYSLSRTSSDRLSFLVYLFPVAVVSLAMSGLRQAIAMGFVMAATDMLFRGKVGWFLAFIILGTGYHGSAFAFLLLWPFVGDRSLRTKLVMLAAIIPPATFLFLASSSADIALERYTNSVLEAEGATFRIGLLAVGATAYLVAFRKEWKVAWPRTVGFADFIAIAVFVILLFALAEVPGVSNVVPDRIGLYFTAFIALILANGLSLLSGSNQKILTLGFLSIYTTFFALWASVGSKFDACYTPYRSFIFG